MKTTCTYASKKHLEWLLKNDRYMKKATLKKKISDKQIIIIQSDKETLGWLRFGLIWDDTPFMHMLFIIEKKRQQGIGKKLVKFWENEMKKLKHDYVITSTQSNEDAQHFYRKLGYKDSGSMELPDEPLELFLIKKI
ncbi:GNAT family N-acetyltransferase [Patescibacteria group bacterium]